MRTRVRRTRGTQEARTAATRGEARQVLAVLERLCGAPPADGKVRGVHGPAAPRGARLRPCCHALLCVPCAADLVRRGDACPACRAAVERFEEGAFDTTFAPA